MRVHVAEAELNGIREYQTNQEKKKEKRKRKENKERKKRYQWPKNTRAFPHSIRYASLSFFALVFEPPLLFVCLSICLFISL